MDQCVAVLECRTRLFGIIVVIIIIIRLVQSFPPVLCNSQAHPLFSQNTKGFFSFLWLVDSISLVFLLCLLNMLVIAYEAALG